MKSHTNYLTFETAGPWQQVFYCEFDGRRAKRVVIKAMGD